MTIEDMRKRHAQREGVELDACEGECESPTCPEKMKRDIAFLLSTLDAIAAETRVRPYDDYPLWVEKVHALATRGKE